MKKNVWKIFSILMVAAVLGSFAACGPKYDEVDEKDLSRWIVKFTSDYPSDLPEEGVEYSLLALKEMNLNENDFTITLPYNPEYEEEGKANKEFTLEPKTEFYYVNDEGSKVLVDSLNTEKDYYFMRDILHEVDEDGQLHHVQRIFDWGEYQLDYAFGTTLNAVGMPDDTIYNFWIKIIVEV